MRFKAFIDKDNNIIKLPCEVVRKYYKYQYSNWTQPTLTANGTMGGNSFACNQIASHTSSTLAFRCFNGDVSSSGETNRWQVNSVNTSSWYWLSWYNPQPLNITKLVITNAEASYCVKNYIIQGSDNNSNWVDIVSGTNTNTNGLSQWTINMSNNEKAYKYHRIYCQPNNGASLQIAEITITATQRITTNGTKDNHDFYEDRQQFYGIL